MRDTYHLTARNSAIFCGMLAAVITIVLGTAIGIILSAIGTKNGISDLGSSKLGVLLAPFVSFVVSVIRYAIVMGRKE